MGEAVELDGVGEGRAARRIVMMRHMEWNEASAVCRITFFESVLKIVAVSIPNLETLHSSLILFHSTFHSLR